MGGERMRDADVAAGLLLTGSRPWPARRRWLAPWERYHPITHLHSCRATGTEL